MCYLISLDLDPRDELFKAKAPQDKPLLTLALCKQLWVDGYQNAAVNTLEALVSIHSSFSQAHHYSLLVGLGFDLPSFLPSSSACPSNFYLVASFAARGGCGRGQRQPVVGPFIAASAGEEADCCQGIAITIILHSALLMAPLCAIRNNLYFRSSSNWGNGVLIRESNIRYRSLHYCRLM